MSAFKPIKTSIKSRFPRAVSGYRYLRNAITLPALATIFSEIYQTNAWQDSESVSGRGSTLARTKVIRSHLPTLLQELRAETLLDAACGDFDWMRHIELGDVNYVGVEIVPDLVQRNRRLYEGQRKTFALFDITRDRLPDVDVILCRDCLIHLSFARIKKTIGNFKKTTAKHLLCTTYITVSENIFAVMARGDL